MAYHVEFTKSAAKELKKLDHPMRKLIYDWLMDHIEGAEDPRIYGRALVADWKGLWRYRVADYRLICQIEDDRVVVYVMSVGHRREVYRH